MKRLIKLSGKKFVAQHWWSELNNDYTNAWKMTEYLIRKIREKNLPNADELIGKLLDECWKKYPLF